MTAPAEKVLVCKKTNILFNPCPAEPGYILPWQQCRSRSVGF